MNGLSIAVGVCICMNAITSEREMQAAVEEKAEVIAPWDSAVTYSEGDKVAGIWVNWVSYMDGNICNPPEDGFGWSEDIE